MSCDGGGGAGGGGHPEPGASDKSTRFPAGKISGPVSNDDTLLLV